VFPHLLHEAAAAAPLAAKASLWQEGTEGAAGNSSSAVQGPIEQLHTSHYCIIPL
jgi:hypothetical protein